MLVFLFSLNQAVFILKSGRQTDRAEALVKDSRIGKPKRVFSLFSDQQQAISSSSQEAMFISSSINAGHSHSPHSGIIILLVRFTTAGMGISCKAGLQDGDLRAFRAPLMHDIIHLRIYVDHGQGAPMGSSRPGRLRLQYTLPSDS